LLGAELAGDSFPELPEFSCFTGAEPLKGLESEEMGELVLLGELLREGALVTGAPVLLFKSEEMGREREELVTDLGMA